MNSHGVASDAGVPLITKKRPGLRWVVACFTAFYAVMLLGAWRPQFFSTETVGDGLDSGWAFALHAFHAEGYQFGRDAVFTYGPLGFLEPRFYHPATYVFVLLRSVAFALVFWFALWSYGLRTVWHPLAVGLWLLALTTLANISVRLNGHQPEYVLCALAIVIHFFRQPVRSPLVWWLVLASLALAGLIKFSYLICGLAVIAVISFDELISRTAPKAIAVFAAMYAAFHVAAGQRLASLIPYLTVSSELAGTYSVSMATTEGRWYEVIGFAIAAAAIVAAAACSLPAAPLRRALFATGLTAVVWVLLKQGYVRPDLWHTINADVELLMIVLAVAPAVFESRLATVRFIWVVALIPAALLTTLGWHDFYGTGPTDHFRTTVGEIRANVAAASTYLVRGGAPLRHEYESAIRGLRERTPLPLTQGSVDVYPWDVWLPIVHDAEHNLRPVFLSYAAYTPKLAEMNASHLANSSGPETVLFQVKTIDERLPTLDDAASWPILLTAYELQSVDGEQVVLVRSTDGARPVMRRLHQFVTRIGEPFVLPDHDGPVTIAVNVKPSAAGRLWSIAYKGPMIAMDVWTRTGERRRFRYVQTLANVPFIVSPLITDTQSFIEVARGQMSANRLVDRVAFQISENDAWTIDSLIDVSVSAIDKSTTNGLP